MSFKSADVREKTKYLICLVNEDSLVNEYKLKIYNNIITTNNEKSLQEQMTFYMGRY